MRLVVVLLEFNRKVEDDELFGQALLVLTQVVFAPKMRLEVVVVAVKLVLPQSGREHVITRSYTCHTYILSRLPLPIRFSNRQHPLNPKP